MQVLQLDGAQYIPNTVFWKTSEWAA